jgi:hypothetical protein
MSSKCCAKPRRGAKPRDDGNVPPICNVWVDWRSETDKYMQKTFCPLAIDTDTDPNTRSYPDKISGGGWDSRPAVETYAPFPRGAIGDRYAKY